MTDAQEAKKATMKTVDRLNRALVSAACLVSLAREGRVNSWLFANHPMAAGPAPAGYTWSLGLLYAVFAVCLILLYFPCHWFATLRAKRKSKWLSYL